MKYFLGIDIGTSGTKTLICDERGRVRATATAPHAISQPRARQNGNVVTITEIVDYH